MTATVIGRSEKQFERVVITGSTTEALGGATAAVLALIGLAGTDPLSMAAVASIALGAVFLVSSGLFAAEYRKVMNHTESTPWSAAEYGGGLGAQAVAGIAAIMLGILALLGINPYILLSTTAIVLGAGLLFGSGVVARMAAVRPERQETADAYSGRLTKQVATGASGGQSIIGFGAALLGLLGLLNFTPLLLVLTALLGLGLISLVSGSAMAGRVLSLFGAA